MSDWDDVLTSTAHLFTDTFGETVTYTKRNGTTRSITAVVSREPAEAIPGAGTMGRHIKITVRNDATTGISATELNYGGDKISVALVKGGALPAQGRTLPEPERQDAGMLTFILR